MGKANEAPKEETEAMNFEKATENLRIKIEEAEQELRRNPTSFPTRI